MHMFLLMSESNKTLVCLCCSTYLIHTLPDAAHFRRRFFQVIVMLVHFDLLNSC